MNDKHLEVALLECLNGFSKAFALLDRDGCILQKNEAFEKLWSLCNKEELNLFKLISANSGGKEVNIPVLASKLKEYQSFTYELALSQEERTDFILIEASPFIPKAGEERLFLAFFERQGLAQEERDRLQLAARAANMGVWDYFPVENELYWDEKMYELYGIDKAKSTGAYDAWASTLTPESLEDAQKELELALKGEKDFKTEFEIILPNGDKRTIAGEAVVKRNAHGEAIRMIGVNYDISSNIEHLRELNMFRSIVESVGESIIITNADPYNPIILYSNPAHEKMTGYSSEEVLGQSPKLFQGPDSNRAELDRIREALIAGEDLQIELKNHKKDGEVFWINMINTFVRNEANEITHFISIQRDVTNRKVEELEMLQAKEEAELASKSKSEFLSVMSHEIRTPLNAVIGVSGLLDGTKLDSEQKDLVNTIRQGGENLLSVINDILDFSKIESGRIELEQVEFELKNPVEDVIDLLSTQAFEKGLELMAKIDDEVEGLFLGDIGRIRQILMNLIGNAIKFTDKGEVIMSLLLATENEDYCEFEFQVKDTGIGIPANKLGRLFRSFSQVDPSTTRKYGGSGLGLAIAKKLVHVMGGEIWVTSEENKGTTFFFTLKLAKAKTQKSQLSSTSSLKGKQILIIDDNNTSLSILEAQLTEKEILVSRYDKPKDLMRTLGRGNLPDWDLAILDYYMPEMNGLELADAIKDIPVYKDLPLILLSSGMLKSHKALNEVFDKIIQKPVKKEILIGQISEVLFPENPNDKGSAIAVGSEREVDLSTYSVLLVEDNIINQKVAKKILKLFNLEVEVANNGEEALDFIHLRTFDLVFMDMRMPVMDGLNATQKIRDLYGKIQQPVIIAMTANTSLEDREKCTQAGMDDFISKPISPKVIKNTLMKWLSVQREV